MAGGRVIRGWGRHGSCLVTGGKGLPPVPCSIWWCWEKGLLQIPQLGPQTAAYHQVFGGSSHLVIG